MSDTKDELQRKLEAASNVIGKVFFAIRDSIEEQHRDIGYLLDKLALHERIASALGDHLEDVLDAMNQGSGKNQDECKEDWRRESSDRSVYSMQEAHAVVHAQAAAERRTRWTLFAEACAARTYCIGPAGRMRW